MRVQLFAIGAMMIALQSPAAHAEPSGKDMVDGLNAVFGDKGKRASHAKGFCAAGTFTPTKEAAAYATPAFAAGSHPVTARFSIAGGNPAASDKARAARGLAIDVKLPGEQGLTLVMISTPMFFAATRESFLAFLEARRPDPATGKPDPKKVAASDLANPDSEAQRRWLAATAPSASYATAPYYPVHTYQFAAADGAKTPARFIFEPIAGRIGLTADEMKAKPDGFLEDELKARLAQGAAEWRALLQLPEATDPLHNVVVAWPETRKTVEVGRLTIDRVIAAGGEGDCDPQVFDPSNLPTGIEPAGDPIFGVRSEAYAVSLTRRAKSRAQ